MKGEKGDDLATKTNDSNATISLESSDVRGMNVPPFHSTPLHGMAVEWNSHDRSME